MPNEATFLVFGRHDPKLVRHYTHWPEVYRSMSPGDAVANHIHVTSISSETAILESALGIDPDNASTWVFRASQTGQPNPLTGPIEKCLADVSEEAVRGSARDALVDLLALAKAGHTICYQPY